MGNVSVIFIQRRRKVLVLNRLWMFFRFEIHRKFHLNICTSSLRSILLIEEIFYPLRRRKIIFSPFGGVNQFFSSSQRRKLHILIRKKWSKYADCSHGRRKCIVLLRQTEKMHCFTPPNGENMIFRLPEENDISPMEEYWIIERTSMRINEWTRERMG